MDARQSSLSKPVTAARLLAPCRSQCAICRHWARQPICADCLQRYAQPAIRCWTCATRLPPGLSSTTQPRCGRCLQQAPPLDRCIAALDYGFPWDGLLQRFKFHQGLELGACLVDRLDEALSSAQAARPDCLLPVPLTPQRLCERGYNQSYELARRLARRHQLKCAPDLLLRVRHTEQQARLSLQERAANVRRAFAIEPRRAKDLHGQHIALLDDVMTSGATLFELARVLRQAGASHVQAWILARTPEPDQP
ncbi:ComF family protein [Roseateles sp. PN1]|uniref:ComF family protein n=1 Tax=Roseateles sp. PN1 TaxID=3137372 RepID=UPI00313A18D4